MNKTQLGVKDSVWKGETFRGRKMVKNLPHYARHPKLIRELFLKSAIDKTADYKLTELFSSLAIQRSNVNQSTKQFIQYVGNLKRVLYAFIEKQQAIVGIEPGASFFSKSSTLQLLFIYPFGGLKKNSHL